jgi:hypothetical protein
MNFEHVTSVPCVRSRRLSEWPKEATVRTTMRTIIAVAVMVAVGGAFALIKQHNKLGDAYAQQALRFLIEGVPNANNDYNRNLHELEVQVSSPAEKKSFDTIVALKTADDDFEKNHFRTVKSD